MRFRFFTPITVALLLAACASEPEKFEASPNAAMWRQIIVQFDQQTGKQKGLRLITTAGTKDFVEGDGTPASGQEPPQNVLWGNTSQLEVIEGSNCVTIAGRKYCG